MNRTLPIKRALTVAAAATVTAGVITGCDRIAGDLTVPWPVAGPSADPTHLEPGLWRAVPPRENEAGCSYVLLRDGTPILWGEVRDSVPTFVYLPQTTADTTYSFMATGCGEWTVAR